MTELARVVALADLLDQQKARVDALTDELKAASAAMLRTEREDLPQLMMEVGLTEITLDSGARVTLKEDCDTKITDKTRDRALAWLMENGYAGLIKTSVSIEFGRGEHDEAVQLKEALSEYDPELKEGVHHSTLKAFVKERLNAGEPIPMDLFNIHPYHKAVIKR